MQPIATDALARIDTPQNRIIGIAVLAVIFAALVFYVVRALRRRAERKRLHETIASIGVEYLREVLVPDGMGGSMHVDYLLLTSRGIVVIDLREVRGNILAATR